MENLKKAMIIRNGNVVGAVGDKNFSTLHIGCITPYLGTKDKIPRGYLLADGASYKTTDYPELFDIIGYTYGGSDGTFNVPNLCDGRFLEGSDTSGEYVEAGLPNIEGSVGYLKSVANKDLTNEWNGAFKWTTYSATSNIPSQTNSANSYDLEFDASKSNAIYSDDVDTVQPKSLRVLYIIKAFHTNEGTDSKNEVSDPIIEYVEGEVATKQENIFKKHITSRKGDASDTKPYCLIATLKTSNLTFVNEPIIIEGVMGNATSSTQKMLFKASFDFRNGAKETAKVIYGYVNQSSLFSHIDLITTFDESAEIAYVYVHHKTNYSIIDADISVPQRNAELYLTIPETFGKTDTIIGTEAHRMSTSTNVKVLAGLDDTTSSSENTWSSSKIASTMPTTRSLTLKSGYAGYITEVYDPTTKVVVYNVNINGTFKGLGNAIAEGFKVPKGATSGADEMHTTLGIYGAKNVSTGDAQFTRLLIRSYSNPFLDIDAQGDYIINGTITYVTA